MIVVRSRTDLSRRGGRNGGLRAGDRGSDAWAVEETKDYYQERAREYGDWTGRTGTREGGSESDRSVYGEAGILAAALRDFDLSGNVLEIACGPGIWTEEVARGGASVTALDSSAGMISRARERLKGVANVAFVNADFYSWNPPMRFDGVTFSFFVSHVPRARLDGFASKVAGCLRRGGKVFFVDQRWEERGIETYAGEDMVRRALADGREFRVVKRYYQPRELGDAFRNQGVELEFGFTPKHFFWARGAKE